MYSLSEIIKRYNDSVSDYAAYLVAINEHQADAQAQHLRNAGEGLSQVLEQALKLHAKTHSPAVFARHAKDSTPVIISTFYLDDAGHTKHLYSHTVDAGITPASDFAYMKSHKYDLTNWSKHEGGVVNPAVVVEYIKQIKLFITEYLDKKAILRETAYFMEAKQDNIQQFYVACDHFQREDRTYILLTEKVSGVDQRYYSHFSLAPWDIVIDFDCNSGDNGFSAGAYHGGFDVAHIYKTSDIVAADDITSNMQKPIYYYANGFKSERSYNDYDEWNRYYYAKLERFLQAITPNIVAQKTVVVSLLGNEEYTESLRNLFGRYFANLRFIIANDVRDQLLGLCQRKPNYYEHTRTSIQEIDSCFSEYLHVGIKASESTDSFSLPYIQGEGSGILTKTELQNLEECFEVLYAGIGDGTDEQSETYLRGETPLTWQGAKRGFAAKRDRFQRMYVKPLETVIRNGRGKIYIIHEPGFGGTTIARQLAYGFHESYPVLILKNFNNRAVIQKLDWLHDRTKKTLVVFMEIPSVISADEFENLYQSINQSRPYAFIGITRGRSMPNAITVTDWGNDVVMLLDKYRPVIEERYSGSQKEEKLAEMQRIVNNGDNPYERTPFYFGMLTYEKDFVAADGFFEKFVKVVEGNELQRKFLIYLAISDVFADKPLPEPFFKTVFGVDKNAVFKLERYFDDGDSILESLIQTKTIGNVRYVRPKYTFFSKTLLIKLLRKENTPLDTGWMENLGNYCRELIRESAMSPVALRMEEDILQPLFIGSSREREGEKFTELVETIQTEERVSIFLELHEQFPDNPHFCSHLARYYAKIEKNMHNALEYSDRAIRLSLKPDPLLHHMKGMCLYYIICDKIDKAKRQIKIGNTVDETDYLEITENLLSQAEAEFQKSREIQRKAHHEDEYGYISNIKLLIRVFDFCVIANHETNRNVIANAKEPYITWLDKAQSLLENARRLHEEGTESALFIDCETSLWKEYEDYSSLIEKLNNQLSKTTHPALVRRQLAQIYMKRDDSYKTSVKSNERILTLMDDNMRTDGKNINNFLLWFKAARYSSHQTDEILTRLAQWNTAYPSLDLSFYSFVFNTIKAIEGSSEAMVLAKKYLQECRAMGGNNRIYIKEWYGDAPQGIISNYEKTNSNDGLLLYEVTGYVREYQHPGNAVIELDCGMEVFFKPSVKGITESSLNHNVKFNLGFSYDGLRAENESVTIIE